MKKILQNEEVTFDMSQQCDITEDLKFPSKMEHQAIGADCIKSYNLSFSFVAVLALKPLIIIFKQNL